MDPAETIFRLLDEWRHLPAYQLERRADIFFAVYLRDVLAEFVGHAIHEVVIPELPLKRVSDHKSKKVDYALFAADCSRAYLVELKTEVLSRRDEQDRYLDDAKGAGMREVVGGICDLVRATQHKHKYLHLVARLEALGLVEVPEGLRAAVHGDGPSDRGTAGVLLEQLRPSRADPPIEIVYVQPVADPNHRCIDFERFAVVVDRREDLFSKSFATALRRWRAPAGRVAPT